MNLNKLQAALNQPLTPLPLPNGTEDARSDCKYQVGTYDARNGELALGAYTAQFHQLLNQVGVSHRYCFGGGTHSWPFWQTDFVDWLGYVYGTTPAACNNA